MFDSKDYSMKGFGDEVVVFLLVLVAIVVFIISYVYTKLPSWLPESETEVITENENTSRNWEGRVRTSEHECSICLGETLLAVETNCGHIFCGACIFTYYSMADSGPLTAPTCPYCRQRITILLPFFSEVERNSADLELVESRNELLEKVKSYNKRFSGEPRSFMELLRDIPMLLRHLWSMLWSGEGLHLIFRLRILMLSGVAIVYILSPFDIIPEVAFGIFGLLDDLLISGLFLMYATILFRNFLGRGEA